MLSTFIPDWYFRASRTRRDCLLVLRNTNVCRAGALRIKLRARLLDGLLRDIFFSTVLDKQVDFSSTRVKIMSNLCETCQWNRSLVVSFMRHTLLVSVSWGLTHMFPGHVGQQCWERMLVCCECIQTHIKVPRELSAAYTEQNSDQVPLLCL